MKTLKKFYSEMLEKHSSSFKTSDYLGNFLRLIKPKVEILDISCGTGGNCNLATQKGFCVTGIDISERMIEVAKNKYPKINFYVEDFRKMDLPKEKFNGIIGAYSLIHTPKNEFHIILKKINSMLIGNGYLYLSLHTGKPKEIILNELFGIKTNLFLNIMSVKEIKKSLEKAGFKIIFKKTRKPKSSEINFNKLFIIAKKINNNSWNEELNLYDEASLIVQTTNNCTKDCSMCPFVKGDKILNQKIYLQNLKRIKSGSLVSLRGGEITSIKNWFEKFIKPTLKRKLKVVVETNGNFIESSNYKKIIKKLSSKNIFLRMSFDKTHLEKMGGNGQTREFKRVAFFAHNATQSKINFGFYSLMSEEKILEFIKETELEPFKDKFHSLEYFPKLTKVTLKKGKYLSVEGRLSKYIKF